MKKLVATLLIGFTTLIAACSGGAPSRAEAFHQAIDRGQVSEAIAMIDPAAVQQVGEVNIRAALAKDAEFDKAAGGLKTISVKGEEQGELASYEVTLVFGNGKVRNEKTKLVKIQGKWYVAVR